MMNITAKYLDEEKTKISTEVSGIEPGDLPVEYGVDTMTFPEINLRGFALLPDFFSAWIAAGGQPEPYL